MNIIKYGNLKIMIYNGAVIKIQAHSINFFFFFLPFVVSRSSLFEECFSLTFFSGFKILNSETRPDTDSACFQAEALSSCRRVMVSLWIDRPLGYFVVNMPID